MLAGALVLACALLFGMLLGPKALGLSSAPGCASGYGGYGGYGGYSGYGGHHPPPGGYSGYGGYGGYGGFGHCYDGPTGPKAFLSADPGYPHTGAQVTFDSAGSYDLDNDITARDWDLDGDGQYDDAHGATATTSFSSTGDHVVGLRLTDSTGLTFALRKTINVHSGDWSPRANVVGVASFPFFNPPVTVGQPKQFSAGAQDFDTRSTDLTIQWDLDQDGQFDDATGQTITTTFNSPGTHTIKARVNDGLAPAVVAASTFDVGTNGTSVPPLGPLAANPAWPRVGRVTHFTTGNFACCAYTIDWDFGDGGNATGYSTDHTFAAAGVPIVGMFEKSGATTVASSTSPLPVSDTNIPPTVSLYVSPPDPRTGQQMSFFAYGGDPDGVQPGGLTFDWDTDNDGQFDDGSGSTISRPAPPAGPASIAVRATDVDGGTAIVRIDAPIRSVQPMAAFTHSPSSPQVGALVHLDSQSVDSDGTLVAQDWDTDNDGQFDDASGAHVTTTFAGEGKHIVKLRVRDSSGDIDAVAHTVNVVAGESVTQPAAPGGTVSTGNTPTEADPVTTSVTTPTGGTIGIQEGERTQSTPGGYSLFGQQVDITAPAATAANPLSITFKVDASIVPSGVTASNIVLFRNGVPIADCADAGGSANPDPCISDRSSLAGGDISLTVLTSHASVWNFGAVATTGGGGSGGGGGGTTETTTTPTPTPTTTTPTPVPSVKDTTPPTATIAVVKGQKLAKALKKGLKVSVKCSEACSIQASAQIAKALAKKLKLGKKAVIVARGSGRLSRAGTAVVVLKFTAAAKRKLAKLRSVPLALQALATDTSGNSRTVKSAVKLKR